MHSPLYITKSISLDQVTTLFVYDKASNHLDEIIEQFVLSYRKEKQMSGPAKNAMIYKLLKLCRNEDVSKSTFKCVAYMNVLCT